MTDNIHEIGAEYIDIGGVKYPLMKELVQHKQNIEKKLAETSFERNIFLMMKYRDYNSKLGAFIIDTLKRKRINCIRADMTAWNLTGDSVLNPLAVLYCCKYGIALFDKPDDGESFGPNVAYELAIMHYQRKNSLILLHKDIKSKKPFDIITKMHTEYDRELDVKEPIESWIKGLKINGRTGTINATNGKSSGRTKVRETTPDITLRKCDTVVRLLNLDGDCHITEQYSIEAKKRLEYKHRVELFSFDNSMNWDNLDLKATEPHSGVSLEIVTERDLPNAKTFQITCTLKKQAPYLFEYGYNWNGMFPKGDEAYTILFHAEMSTFRLEYPAEWQIKELCPVDSHTGEPVKPKSALAGKLGGLQYLECSFGKPFKGARIRFKWTRQLNGKNT